MSHRNAHPIGTLTERWLPVTRPSIDNKRTKPEDTPVYAGDADLVRDCLEGDAEAWQRLIRRYEDLIYSIARLHGLDADDAADVFQTVSLALWKGLSELRSEKALTRWIQVTTRRQSDRALSRKRRSLQANEESLLRLPDENPEILERVVQAEEQHHVRKCVEKLPAQCAQLITALYLEDPPWTYDEIADRLGVPRGSIGPTRSRCLDKLRKILS